MKYLFFVVEEYYPRGGLKDIKGVYDDDKGLLLAINNKLKKLKMSFEKKHNSLKEELKEAYENEDTFDIKHLSSKLKNIYDDYSIYQSFDIFCFEDNTIYFIPEKNIIERLRLKENHIEEISSIDELFSISLKDVELKKLGDGQIEQL